MFLLSLVFIFLFWFLLWFIFVCIAHETSFMRSGKNSYSFQDPPCLLNRRYEVLVDVFECLKNQIKSISWSVNLNYDRYNHSYKVFNLKCHETLDTVIDDWQKKLWSDVLPPMYIIASHSSFIIQAICKPFIKNNNSMPEESQRRPFLVLIRITIAMKIGTTRLVFAEGQVHMKPNENY